MEQEQINQRNELQCVGLSAQGLALHEVFLTVIFRIPGFGCTYLNSYHFNRLVT